MVCRNKKEQMISKIESVLNDYSTVLVMRNVGITANRMNSLRMLLYKEQSGALVVKNTLLSIAVDSTGYNQDIKQSTQGMVLLVYSNDLVGVAKLVHSFCKDDGDLQVDSCYCGDSTLDSDDVKKLSKLSSAKDLYAMLLSSLQAPAGVLHSMLGAPARNLHAVLQGCVNSKNNE